MYGTVARLKVKPGATDQLMAIGNRDLNAGTYPDLVSQIVFRLDSNPDEYVMAVVFTSKEAYRANAESPEQHARYLELRALLDADPEWLDGEVVQKLP